MITVPKAMLLCAPKLIWKWLRHLMLGNIQKKKRNIKKQGKCYRDYRAMTSRETKRNMRLWGSWTECLQFIGLCVCFYYMSGKLLLSVILSSIVLILAWGTDFVLLFNMLNVCLSGLYTVLQEIKKQLQPNFWMF